MHVLRTLLLTLGATAAGVAQTTPATPVQPDPGSDRLERALATMCALPSCGFEARWGPDRKPKEEDEGAAMVRLLIAGRSNLATPGEATGAWGRGLLHLEIGDDEVVLAGRRAIARNDKQPWALRRDRKVEGQELGYVPDPEALLDLLATMELKVTHRQPGAVDDRPVELLSVSLNEEQVRDLTWSGALPQLAGASDDGRILRVAMAVRAGGKAAAPVSDGPTTTVDLVLAVDPGTGFVHRVQFRCYDDDANEAIAGRVVFVGGPAGGVAKAAEEEEEEEAEEAEAAADAGAEPLRYADGLPVRSRKKKTVNDFVIEFRDHGQAAMPPLDARAQRLLGK